MIVSVVTRHDYDPPTGSKGQRGSNLNPGKLVLGLNITSLLSQD